MTFRPAAILLAALCALCVAACCERGADGGPIVLAPSSMQEALDDCASEFARAGHPRPVVSFAGTPALARQVLAGAPADLFVSADPGWMDRVEQADRIDSASRTDLAGNALVLIAPAGSGGSLDLDPVSFARALGHGPLAMADATSVPAGRYGKAALEQLGLWPAPAPISASENVRAALALVERRQAPLGLVYASDALASDKVTVVAELPAKSHPPIRYPIAVVAGSTNPQTAQFRAFLLSGDGQAILSRHGFTAP